MGTDTIETFVRDIVRRSKDCERLIAALPRKDESSARVRRATRLIIVVNRSRLIIAGPEAGSLES
jgi:hypothetical protein